MKLLTPVLWGVVLAVVLLSLSSCALPSAEESEAASETPATEATTTVITTQPTAAPFPSVGYCVADPSMHVRSGPGPYEEVIGGLARGEQVHIVGKEGDWFRITFKDGFAYVSAQYIRDTPPSDPVPTSSAPVTTESTESSTVITNDPNRE